MLHTQACSNSKNENCQNKTTLETPTWVPRTSKAKPFGAHKYMHAASLQVFYQSCPCSITISVACNPFLVFLWCVSPSNDFPVVHAMLAKNVALHRLETISRQCLLLQRKWHRIDYMCWILLCSASWSCTLNRWCCPSELPVRFLLHKAS